MWFVGIGASPGDSDTAARIAAASVSKWVPSWVPTASHGGTLSIRASSEQAPLVHPSPVAFVMSIWAGQKLGGCPPAKFSRGRKAGHFWTHLPLPQGNSPPALWQGQVSAAALAGWAPSCFSPANTPKEGRAPGATAWLQQDQPLQGKEDKGKFLSESSVPRDQELHHRNRKNLILPWGRKLSTLCPGRAQASYPALLTCDAKTSTGRGLYHALPVLPRTASATVACLSLGPPWLRGTIQCSQRTPVKEG